MNKEVACFLCGTPYQIITAIHLAVNHNMDADLFIVDMVRGTETVVKRILQTGIFSNVNIVHEKDAIGKVRSRCMQYINVAAVTCLRLDSTVEKYINKKRKYNKLYFSSRAAIPRMFLMYFQKHKYDFEYMYFDDGLGSYYNKWTIHEKATDRLIGKAILGKSYKGLDVRKLLLYSPDLFNIAQVNCSEKIDIQRIPAWDKNLITMLNGIFGYSANDEIKESVIILDCCIPDKQRKPVEDFYTKVVELIGRENVIIKSHPRNKGNQIDGLKYYDNSEIPFELICANLDMTDKLLITISSTAVVTPVLLFGKEPYILTLDDTELGFDEKLKIRFEDIASLYHERCRFMVGKSLKGAIDFVKKYVIEEIKDN